MSEMEDVLEKPYQCAVCDERFSEKSAREKHYFIHVNKAFGVKSCRICDGYCMNSEHRRILQARRKKPVNCECRMSVTIEKESFKIHCVTQKNEALSKSKYICDACGKSYTTKSYLMLHLNTHFNIRPYVCHVCNIAFRTRTTLRIHLHVHSNVKAYACEFCNRRFKTKQLLRHHYLTHTQEKPYVCEVCSRGFSKRGNLKTHYRTHNKIKTE